MNARNNNKENSKNDLTALARTLAKHASEDNFASGIGCYIASVKEGFTALVIYNNHPNDLREKETAQFRLWLRDAGICERAYGTYPAEGDDAGYTFAMIIDVSEERGEEVYVAYVDAITTVRGAECWSNARAKLRGGIPVRGGNRRLKVEH